MKVLLTGATGFVGSEIARQLVAEGHEVRVLVRKTSKLDGLAGIRYEKLEGDILDRASVTRALEGVDALIHTAANVSARPRDKESIFRSNVEGTRTVLEAARDRGGKIRVVYTSSVAAIGAKATPIPHDEETAVWRSGKGYHYIDAKKQAEELALDFAKKGLDLVVLNPGFVLGPGDVYLGSTRMVLEFLKGRLGWITSGGLTFCDVRDVARAHVAALTRGRAGERYIVAGINKTNFEALGEIARLTGKPAPKHAPYPAAWFFGLASETLALVKEHSLEEVNRPLIRYSALYNFTDCKKAERELGYRTRPFEETARDTVKDFLARGLIEPTTDELRALAGVPSPELVTV
jgi:dihydroflavonol-4-reductase